MDNMDELELRELGLDVPRWVERDITVGQVRSIAEGGCGSGAYMPAVEGYTALQTMAEHGDAVVHWLEDYADAFELNPLAESWAGFASRVLTYAVDVWAGVVAEGGELADALEEEAEHPHRAEARAAIRELRRRGFELDRAHAGGDEVIPGWELNTLHDEATLVEDSGEALLRYLHEDGRRVSLLLLLGNGPGELIADGSWSEDPDASDDLEAAIAAAQKAVIA